METIKELKIGNITAKELGDQHYNYWLMMTKDYTNQYDIDTIKLFKDEVIYYDILQQKEVCLRKETITPSRFNRYQF